SPGLRPRGRRGWWSVPSSALDRQPVTESGNRLQAHACVGALRKLAPQPLDVRVDGMVVEVVRITPHLVSQLRARQDSLRVRGQHGEQVEFGHRQRDLVFAHPDPASGVVDLQRAAAQLDRLRTGPGFDDVVALETADLGDQHADGHVVFDHQDAPPATWCSAAQLFVGGAKPTRRDSRAERFGLRIRITRFSPPSSTLASSQPSAAASWRTLTTVTPSLTWAKIRTLVEYSHSRLGYPTDGTRPAAVPRAPSGWGWAGSSGSSSGSSSNRGSIVRRL